MRGCRRIGVNCVRRARRHPMVARPLRDRTVPALSSSWLVWFAPQGDPYRTRNITPLRTLRTQTESLSISASSLPRPFPCEGAVYDGGFIVHSPTHGEPARLLGIGRVPWSLLHT